MENQADGLEMLNVFCLQRRSVGGGGSVVAKSSARELVLIFVRLSQAQAAWDEGRLLIHLGKMLWRYVV